jgi:hypothetical protein
MLAALCLALVFALSLSSYLTLCVTSVGISTRAIMLARGSELAEAGIEEGLYALNNSDWSSPVWTVSGTTATASLTMTAGGLAATSTTPTALNYGNGMNGTVTVTVTNYTATASSTPAPTISAQSSMTMPSYNGLTTLPTISQSVTYSAGSSALTGAAPMFVNAVVATAGAVKFKVAGTVDSYNSNPAITALVNTVTYTICTPGTGNWTAIGAANNNAGTSFVATGPGTGTGTAYVAYAAAIAGYSGVVTSQDVTVSTATVRLNDVTIHGYAVGYDHSSPGTTNWLSYGSSGMLVGPHTAVGTSIDSARIVTEALPYQPVFLERPTSGPPYSTATSLTGAVSTDGSTLNRGSSTVGGTTIGSAGATLPAVYLAGNGITLGSNQIVTVNGPVVIITYGGLTTSFNGGFVLNTPQASLQIFDEYGNVSLAGSTGITYSPAYALANPTQVLPKKVAIIATNNNFSTATISTTASFYGVIYTPYMPITVSSSSTFYGSIVGETVTFSGSPTIHYDLALRAPMPSFSSGIPLQSGAAFDYLSAPLSFGSMLASTQ